MEETIIKAIARNNTTNKVRNAGYIPGVLNDSDTTSVSVQFETLALNKILTKHGSNAKLWVEFNNEKRFGFISEVQRNPVEHLVIHVSVQMIKKDQKVKMQLPITYHGREELEHKFLQIQVIKNEIEVFGDATLMPDVVTIDISEKELGDHVTAVDFQLPKELKILDPENEIYAIIKATKEEVVEDTEEVKPVVEE